MTQVIGPMVFLTMTFLGVAFMVYALTKFHEELKRLKHTCQDDFEPDQIEWRVLSPFVRETTGLTDPANNAEQIVIIETPYCGPIPLVRTVVLLGTRSSGDGANQCISAPRFGRQKVLNFGKRPVG